MSWPNALRISGETYEQLGALRSPMGGAYLILGIEHFQSLRHDKTAMLLSVTCSI